MIRLFSFFLLLALLSGSAEAASVRTEQAGDAYGIDNVVLENDHLRVVASPHYGGRVISLIRKGDQQEFAVWQAENGSGGLLNLIPRATNYPGTLGNLSCHISVLDEGPETAAVRLSFDGTGQFAAGLRFTRELRLRDGEHRLQARLLIENVGFVPKRFGLWVHNYTTLPATKDGDSGFMPTATGVAFRATERVEDFVAGWLALVVPESGSGLLGVANYDQLAWLSFWPAASGSTLEWAYESAEIAPGATWQSEVVLMPLHGLTAVHAATADFAAGISDNQLRIFQADSESRSYRAGDRERLTIEQPGAHQTALPEGASQLVTATEQVELRMALIAGRTAAVEIPAKAPPPLLQSRVETLSITPTERKAEERTRVLVLSFWDYGNAAWGTAEEFPEIETYTKPMANPAYDFAYYFGQVIYSQRWAFQAREHAQHFLKGDTRFAIDVAFETDFLNYLVNLYDYDVLVINDFPAGALEPYLEELREYVSSGHGLYFSGGYQAYGGWGKDFGNWEALAPLLPVRIAQSPDHVDQTPMRETEWLEHYPRHRAKARPNPYGAIYDIHRIGPWVTCANFWHRSEWRWMNEGLPVAVTEAGAPHPVTAGLDWRAITPNYHRVQPKEDATVLADIDGTPLLVAQQLGEGRILASTICDERRLYFWQDTARFHRQALHWLAGTEQPTLALAVAEGTLRASGHGGSAGPLAITIVGDDYRRYPLPAVQLAPGESVQVRLPELPPMRHRIEARWGETEAALSVELAEQDEAKAGLAINFHNRHVFLQGESVRFDLPLGAERYAIIDSHGATLHEERAPAVGAQSVATDGWALGDYALTVTLTDGNDVERFHVGRLPEAYLSLSWAELPIYQAGESFAAYASLARAVEYGATAYSAGGRSHFFGIADYLLKAGLQGFVRSGQASYAAPLEPATETFIKQLYHEQMRPWAAYPAVRRVFVDDEGTSYWWQNWHNREPGALEALFEERYGRPLRQFPETKQEKVELAHFYDDTYNMLIAQHRQAIHEVRPDWELTYVLSPFHSGMLGTYAPAQFEHSDFIDMDGYPVTVGDIGECFLLYNLLRTISQRQNKPALAWLGEYRNDPASIRMQHWLFTATGLGNRRWYTSGGGERTGIYRREAIETITPADRQLQRLAPLVAAWSLAPSRIGIVMPRDALAHAEKTEAMPWEKGGSKQSFKPHTVGRAYMAQLEQVLRRLYDADLYADLISTSDLEDGTARQYDALICTWVDEWLPSTVAQVGELAAGKVLVHAASAEHDRQAKLSGAIDLDDAAIARLVAMAPPAAETPAKDVYAHMLQAEEGRWLALYNHHRERRTCQAVLPSTLSATHAVDMDTHESFPLRRSDRGLELACEVGSYDGRLLWLTDTPDVAIEITSLAINGASNDLSLRLATLAAPIAVKVELFDPSGEATQHGDLHLVGREGLSLSHQLGANVAPGTWTITITNQFSGRQLTQSFNISNRKR